MDAMLECGPSVTFWVSKRFSVEASFYTGYTGGRVPGGNSRGQLGQGERSMRRSSILLSVILVFWLLSFPLTLNVSCVSLSLFKIVSVFNQSVCGAAGESEYVIGPDDVLSVVIRERPDLSGTFTVGPEGAVTLPLSGEVKASGLTPYQLSKEISRKLSVYRAGDAIVTVLQYNSRKIFVVGAVTKPGKYTFSVIPSIWDVLSEAGGPTEVALLSGVQVIRAGTGETITVDVGKVLSGAAKEQVKLQPGDTIRVPSRTSSGSTGNVVYVLGEVKLPGSYEVAMARDLVAAVLAAGGPTEMAELRRVTIVRRTASGTTAMKINLEKFLKEGMVFSNPEIRPGDTITVSRKRSVLGTLFSPPIFTAILSATASIVIITHR
jgi:polysaccharide export outer membrane protein